MIFRGSTTVPRYSYDKGYQEKTADLERQVAIRINGTKLSVPLVVFDGVHDTDAYRFQAESWYAEDGRDNRDQAYRRLKVFGTHNGWHGWGKEERQEPEYLSLQSWYEHPHECFVVVAYVKKERHPWGKGSYHKRELSTTVVQGMNLWQIEEAIKALGLRQI